MVEMRWEIRKRPVDAFVIEGSVSRTYSVLQYRVKDDYSGHNDDPDWGQWQDVPAVCAP